MSEEIKEKSFFTKQTSRRDFLKVGSKGLVGAAVSMSFLRFFTGSTSAEGFALASGLLISDVSRCTGCRRCEMLCTVANDGKIHPHISRVKVGRNYNFGTDGVGRNWAEEAGNYGTAAIIADTCKQCADPVPCAEACPVGAIVAQEGTNTRVVNEDTCIGCGMCSNACPWNVITVDADDRKAKKCFLCDGDPACASMCPSGSLALIPWKEVRAAIPYRRRYTA